MITFEPWEAERAFEAACDSIRRATHELFCIPTHIMNDMHKRGIERLGHIYPFPASPEPHDSTSSPSDIGRVANIDINGSAEFDWPEPLTKGE